jgi:hypothetical protein
MLLLPTEAMRCEKTHWMTPPFRKSAGNEKLDVNVIESEKDVASAELEGTAEEHLAVATPRLGKPP